MSSGGNDSSPAANAGSNGAGRAPSKGGIPWDILTDLAVFALKIGATVWLGTYLVDKVMNAGSMDSNTSKAKKLLQDRLKGKDLAALELSAHEASFVEDIVDPSGIEESFFHIGGLEDSIESIRDNLILPFRLFSHVQSQSSVATYPTGLLLYGAPGTGKTMIARAIANETGAVFINVKMANVLSKWVGESDKYVCALFSLARKLAPAVIFIDEIDCFLTHRGGAGGEGQHMSTLQANFLTEWDGLRTIKEAPVVVLGATNRPESIDKAILRRMPLMVRTPMPDVSARRDIIRKMLTLERVEDDISIDELAARTEGYSGSDLRELLRVACLQRLKNFDVTRTNTGKATLRPLNAEDFESALQKTNPSQDTARAYAREKQMDAAAESRDGILQSALASFLLAEHARRQQPQQPKSAEEADWSDAGAI